MSTQHNVRFTVPLIVGNRVVDVVCTATPVQGRTPALMWAEIDGKPAPAPIWDAVEAQLDDSGPIGWAYRDAFDRARVPHVAA